MTQALRIAIAGLGTVGAGTLRLLKENAGLLEQRAGRALQVVAVSSRDRTRDRGLDLSDVEWMDDPLKLWARADVDVIVETIGGADGIALELVRGALEAGKHVVTANKAMLAHHGAALAQLAEDRGVMLGYEAAVAGGVPAIKGVREGLAANRVEAVYGILNGTCNYILSQMRETGRDFAAVLADAQAMGYAEADPAFDVDGVDAGHKITLLSAIGFGIRPDFAATSLQGIRDITALDIDFAQELGYRIKLLGVAKRTEDARIYQSVEPCLVPLTHPLAAVEGVLNAVFVKGNFVDMPMFTGRGAGAGPTASAVAADLVDIARGLRLPVFGVPAGSLAQADFADAGALMNSYYLRLNVVDQPGVIADLSAILRDYAISIEALLQRGRDPGQAVPVIIKTHEVRHGAMTEAVRRIEALAACLERPCLMRIEEGLAFG